MNNHSHDNYHPDHDHNNCTLEHHQTVIEEILCHLPFAIFSVAIALICMSLVSVQSHSQMSWISYRLFHNFHYLHLLFAATGTVLIFKKYSNNNVLAIALGFVIPAFFCTISDAFLPYLGGRLINLDMRFHWCFLSHLDIVLPFLIGGIVNGYVMSSHPTSRRLIYSTGYHFIHIFVSAMAALLYLVSFGFYEWWDKLGFVFVFLIVVTVIPCTLSDIVVPMFFARLRRK